MFTSTFARRVVVAGLACVAVGGCATYDRTKAAPAQTQPIAIHFSADTLGMNDLPLGAYRVPDSEVIVSGHQKVGGVGMAFGLLGVLVSDAIDTHRGSNAIEATEKALHLRIDDEARSDIEIALASDALQRKFTLGKGTDKTLDITPAVVLTFVNDVDVRPYVELKVALKDASGRSTWDTRYFASTGPERRLDGPGGWADQGGAALKASVSASLAQLVKVMLVDIATPYPRDDARPMLVQASVPYMRQPLQMTGYTLTEDDHYVVFSPKIGDAAVVSGVNVLDRDFIVYRAATAADVTKVLPERVHKAAPAVAAASSAGVTTVTTTTTTTTTAVVAAPRPVLDATAMPAAAPSGMGVRHLDASMVTGKSWVYPHLRDPERYGDVRFEFADDRVEASNKRSHSSGTWTVRNDQLCIAFDNPSWGGSACYYVVDGVNSDDGNDVQLLSVATGRKTPLRIQ